MYKKNRKIISEDDPQLFPMLTRAYIHVVPPYHREECFLLLKLIVQKFQELGVEYWADRGTLLGLTRHGGMLLFDDNNNLAVNSDWWDTIINNKSYFEKLGDVMINKREKYIKISKLDHALQTDTNFKFKVTHGPPTVILTFYTKAGRRLRPSRKLGQYYHTFNQSLIYPLKDASYYNFCDNEDIITLPTPAHPMNVLDIEFPDWTKYWTLRPRVSWSEQLQKTDAPYFPLKFYPDIRDELFQKCFKDAMGVIECYEQDQYKITGTEVITPN